MKLINQIFSDIKRGANIDLYLTIPAAILVGFLNIIGVLPADLVAPLTLVVLGLVTITILGSRYQVEQLSRKMKPSPQSVFKEKFPQTLEEDMRKASELWFVGMLQAKHARDFYHLIEEKLRKGHSIRILTVYPDPEIVKFTEMRVYGVASVKAACSNIEIGLEAFCKLKQIAPSNFEIRTIRYPMNRGFTAINPSSSSGSLYIREYAFQTPGGAKPKFTLHSQDGAWYSFYKRELENIWNAGEEWSC